VWGGSVFLPTLFGNPGEPAEQRFIQLPFHVPFKSTFIGGTETAADPVVSPSLTFCTWRADHFLLSPFFRLFARSPRLNAFSPAHVGFHP